MKNWTKLATGAALFCVTGAFVGTGRADTIAGGLATVIAANGVYTADTVDSAYVTAVFGTNAYIQDATGGIYLYKAGSATQGIPGIALGSQITNLGTNTTGGFYYYTTGTQFEYEPANATTVYSYGMLTAGTYQSIPASYYASLTLAGFNATANQGSVSSTGMQNQLVTISSVTLTLAGVSGGVFAAGSSYTMTDTGGATGIMYINAASGIVGQAVPTGQVNVSGVFQDFHGSSELLPRGIFDVVSAVPEPSTYALLIGGVALGGCAIAHRRQARA